MPVVRGKNGFRRPPPLTILEARPWGYLTPMRTRGPATKVHYLFRYVRGRGFEFIETVPAGRHHILVREGIFAFRGG